MRKPDAPPGWRLLDEFHSPYQTARYVKDAGGGWYRVVDVAREGNRFIVSESVEKGIFEESEDGSRPYIHTEMKSDRMLANMVPEDRAWSAAMSAMRDNSSTDPEFDMF